MSNWCVLRVLVLAALAMAAQAHIGSPDVYFHGKAGPYELFVTVRPPVVIPGVAELEVRSQSPGVQEICAVPTPITGPGAKLAPIPDRLKQSRADPQFFTGSLWIMAPGSWQVRLTADGKRGEGVVAIPLAAAALTTKKMQKPLGIMLALVGLFLVAGLAAIVGASVREVKLEPGTTPDADQKRRGRIATAIAVLVIGTVLCYGNAWWSSEAASYSEQVYKPLQMKSVVDSSGMLTLNVSDPGWLTRQPGPLRRTLFARTMDDLVPDHDHLMHLYMIRQPGFDVVYHVHPEQTGVGIFQLTLPSMPAGSYRLYADIVHANGFPETMVTTLELPQNWKGPPLRGDDCTATAVPWQSASVSETSFSLPDGYRMEWLRETEGSQAKQAAIFRFRLLDPLGRAPGDVRFYMGMLGHAAFVKTDGSVFAHIHPIGSVSMAAFELAQKQSQNGGHTAAMQMSAMEMPGMSHGATGTEGSSSTDALPNEASFPYGFPTLGRYRIFVQMKHRSTIETGIFDADVQ